MSEEHNTVWIGGFGFPCMSANQALAEHEQHPDDCQACKDDETGACAWHEESVREAAADSVRADSYDAHEGR